MKNKSLLKICFGMIFVIVLWIAFPNNVKAASVSVSASKSQVTVGQSVTITVSGDCTGRINITLSGNASASADRVWIENNSSTITVTPNAVGKIVVTATPENPMSSNGTKVEVSPSSCSINVVENAPSTNPGTTTTPSAPSNNANLSNLGIRPNDFKGFKPGTTKYDVSVPEDVEEVEIYATAQDKNAKITGTGKKSLQSGSNSFTVTVTAADGKTTKNYTLNITRDGEATEETEEQEENTEEVPEQVSGNGLASLVIEGLELSPEFETGIYEYEVEYIGTDTKLNIQATGTDPYYIVEVTGNENLTEGENIITILVSDPDGQNVATYQITVNKKLVDEAAIAREQEEQRKQEEKVKMLMIGGAVAGVIILGVIIFIIVRRRRNNEWENDYGEPYPEEFDDVEFPKALKNNNYDDNNYSAYNDDYDDSFESQNEENYQSQKEDYDKELNLDNNQNMEENQLDSNEFSKEQAREEFLNNYNTDSQTSKYDNFDNDVRGKRKGKRFK